MEDFQSGLVAYSLKTTLVDHKETDVGVKYQMLQSQSINWIGVKMSYNVGLPHASVPF